MSLGRSHSWPQTTIDAVFVVIYLWLSSLLEFYINGIVLMFCFVQHDSFEVYLC